MQALRVALQAPAALLLRLQSGSGAAWAGAIVSHAEPVWQGVTCAAAAARGACSSTRPQQQDAAVASASAEAAAGAANSATALSGLVVHLTEGDAWLKSHEAAAGPLLLYKRQRETGAYRKDGRQEVLVEALQRVYDDLAAAHPSASAQRRGSGLTLVDAASPAGDERGAPSGGRAGPAAAPQQRSWWSGLFAAGGGGGGREESTLAAPPPVRGLYMFGGVGCGKTMLMDLLAASAPRQFKLQRTFFHEFMISVHSALRGKAHVADPLALVADDVAAQHRVLLLDEFFVTDVADAMILHRLFGRLWDRGVTLVATSNRAPDALYEGGLQRALFLPFIQRLKTACEVFDMDSPTDYRRLASHRSGLYFVTPSREADLWERFIELANGQPIVPQSVEVAMGRTLLLRQTGGCAAYATFEELCGRPLAAADYIALAGAKHTLLLSGVPVLTGAAKSEAYRFLTLVDVLYENKVRLVMSAEAMPFELFAHIKPQDQAARERRDGTASPDDVVDDNLGFTKERCISRLTEMQSHQYLEAHAAARAPELLLALREARAAREAAAPRCAAR